MRTKLLLFLAVLLVASVMGQPGPSLTPGAALTALPLNTQTVFVDAAGDDTTAVRGRYDKPFATVSNAIIAASAGDTLALRGTFVPRELALRVTNLIVNAYGSLLINTNVNATTPRPFFRPTSSTINGLAIINSGDPEQYQACIGWNFYESGGENAILGSEFVVRDFEGWGDYAVGLFYSTNAVFGNWYNSRFHGKAFGFLAGAGSNNRFYSCLFEALGPSKWSAAEGQFLGYAFAADGTHTGAGHTNSTSTNYFYGCTLISRGEGIAEALEAEHQSQNFLYGCTLDAYAPDSSLTDTSLGVCFIESENVVSLNNCTIRFGGGTNLNLAVNMGGAGGVLYLNNTFHYYGEGTTVSNGIVVNNDGGTVYVSGGNWIPANFSTPTTVVWLSAPQGSYSNYTSAATSRTMNTWAGKVKITAANQTYVVTNNLVTTKSAIEATVVTAATTDDATVFACRVIPAAGRFTLKLNANTSVAADVAWRIISP